MDRVVSRHWHIFGHESQIPNVGDYQVFQIGGESLLIIRAAEKEIRALYNVCRHRGSRLTPAACGHAKRLVCPYHAWTYALDGRLIAAGNMPDTFDKKTHSLEQADVACIEGLIFVSLVKDAEPLDFIERCVPYLQYYGVSATKTAARQIFNIPANWKLVIENFVECYHCTLTHPEYMTVNTVAFVSGVNSALQSADSRRDGAADPRSFVDERRATGFPEGKLPVMSDRIAVLLRKSLRQGYSTASEDGKGVAPLLGSMREYDGLSSLCIFNPFSWMSLYDDHCVIFRITPRDALHTDMEAIWLVRNDAAPDVDYREDRLKWLWRATLEQDKTLVAANQLGTQSRAYRPGPYSLQEDMTDAFVAWYLKRLAAPAPAQHRKVG
jgi:Rieske 2Fe-2S family protein